MNIALVLAAVLVSTAVWAQQAEPVPAYLGCSLAWDYPEEAASRLGGFGIFDGESRLGQVDPEIRVIPCADLDLSIGPHLIGVRAWDKDSGVHSAMAQLAIDYRGEPLDMPAPTNVRIQLQLEWTP
jgi:hypothetical protein